VATLSFDFVEAGENKLTVAIAARFELTGEARVIRTIAFQNSEYVLYVVSLVGKLERRSTRRQEKWNG
jgi:hypothetical protein